MPGTRRNRMRLVVQIDGASRGNPGPAACGVALIHDGETLLERGRYLGKTTNNVAEYRGLLLGLELARQLNATHVTVQSDSELLVRQLAGRYKVKARHLKPLVQQAQRALEAFEGFKIRHIPREANTAADRLANQALDEKGEVG